MFVAKKDQKRIKERIPVRHFRVTCFLHSHAESTQRTGDVDNAVVQGR